MVNGEEESPAVTADMAPWIHGNCSFFCTFPFFFLFFCIFTDYSEQVRKKNICMDKYMSSGNKKKMWTSCTHSMLVLWFAKPKATRTYIFIYYSCANNVWRVNVACNITENTFLKWDQKKEEKKTDTHTHTRRNGK